jgi:hypothetical protein
MICRPQNGGDDVDVDGDFAQTEVDVAPLGSGAAGLLEQTESDCQRLATHPRKGMPV